MKESSRRLTAIVFTDIVGYSTIVHRDEALGARLLDRQRSVVRRVLPAHGGREVETAGDSFLLEFGSALAAVQAVIAIQQELAAHNRKQPESVVVLRASVHLGDVEHRGKEVFGDGVNTAARLLPHSPEGGLALSAPVLGMVKQRIPLPARSIGAPALKNISSPLEIFVVDAGALAGLETSPPGPDALEPGRRVPRRFALFAAGVFVLLAAGIGWRQFAPRSATLDKSVAVLPFTDLSAAHDQEYFADGMAEELLNALAKVRDLKVAGRTSSFSFKGKNEDVRTIGKALAVAHVLEGSVRKQGDKVRITAQLVQVSDGYHLWSESYDGDLSDVFELQERIARAITDQLKVVLQGEQQQRLVPVATDNPEAYELYLQASGIFNRREGKRWPEAIAQLEKAIELDPQFARAHARLAAVAALSAIYMDLPAYPTIVEEHARRASELEPGLAEPHAALAQSHARKREFVASRAEYDRALALEPDDITSNFWSAISLVQTGYSRRGYEQLDRVLALDPKLPNALFWRGMGYFYGGDPASGERLLQRAADAKLAFAGIGLSEIAFLKGEREAAVQQLVEGSRAVQLDLSDEAALVLARGVYGDAAERATALTWISRYLATKPRPVMGIVVRTLLRMDQPKLALAASTVGTNNDSTSFLVLWGSGGTSARRLPEFPEYARKVGFAALWDRYGEPDLCRRRAPGNYVCD